MKTLVIPDLHHDLDWLERVLARELDDTDQIIFLGDYFDFGKTRTRPNATEVARRLYRLAKVKPCVFLAGNHDIPYLYDYLKGTEENSYTPLACSGHMRERSVELGNSAEAGWLFRNMKAAHYEHGTLFTHAGVRGDFFPPEYYTDEAATAMLVRQLNEALPQMKLQDPMFDVGRSRGGWTERGGIFWQDWDREFEDDGRAPQIVGHSGYIKDKNDAAGLATAVWERSMCLDNNQTTYATIVDNVTTVEVA